MEDTSPPTNSFLPHNSAPSAQLDGALVPPPKHRRRIPAGVQPTNFIYISAVDSVRGVYTIDPGLSPPASLTASYPYGHQSGKNAFIESQKGNVNVDFFVLPSSDDQGMISMTVKSQNKSACIRVHDAEPQNTSYIRGPLSIMVNCSRKAEIYIPRSFKGPLQMTTGYTGEVYYSQAVRGKVAPLFSGNGQHKSFIGALPVDEDREQAWLGDQLTVTANEIVNIYYDDEGSIPTQDTGKGHLTRLRRRLTRNAKRSLVRVSPMRPLRKFRYHVALAARNIVTMLVHGV